MSALWIEGEWVAVSLCPICRHPVLDPDAVKHGVLAPCGRRLFVRSNCPPEEQKAAA